MLDFGVHVSIGQVVAGFFSGSGTVSPSLRVDGLSIINSVQTMESLNPKVPSVSTF